MTAIDPVIDELWDRRADLTPDDADARKLVVAAIEQLDTGEARVAQIENGEVVVDERAKRAILLAFKVLPMHESQQPAYGHDRIPLKTHFQGVRVVPGAIARWGSHFEPGVVLMPSYTNIGGYVGSGSMVDTWATVGSCAQIGKNVHLSGGVGIGGVLEPMQANPTIIEDNCFIGARSEIVEGVIVEENSVISMGVYIGQSTKIYDRATGEVSYGRVPAGSVVVSGNLPSADGKYSLYCAVIVKRVDAQTRAKTAINELLRD
jgi:2,3,4,5-tetrahydropyridine-2-carboxylate N-succinyltransferase